MKRILFIIVSLILCCKSNSQVMWEFKKDTVITWNYEQGDEFNGSSINLDYWQYIGSSRSLFANKEQEYYTDGENHFVNNGSLKLTAKKDSVFKRTIDWMKDEDSLFVDKKFYAINKKWHTYTAGKLISKEKFNKGFFECRFKIPPQKGYWPAFWLYGGSPNEEIDMMECKTEMPRQIHLDVHCGNKCDLVQLLFQKISYGGWVKTKGSFTEEFNIAACNWDQNEIRFYLNGECIGISKVKFDVEKNLAINIAVPGEKGPFSPAPSPQDTSTAVFEVDYVRIWSNSTGSGAANAIRPRIQTDLEVLKPIIASSRVKSKGKSLYGKKSEHKDDGVFISFFQNDASIQIYALGKFGSSGPSYKIINASGEEVLKGDIKNQIFDVNTSQLQKGEYSFKVDWNGRSAGKKIRIHS